MPKFNPDNLNIHELAVEDPEKRTVAFNPDRDLTGADRQFMHKYLNGLRKEDGVFQKRDKSHSLNWLYFSECAADMKIVGENPDILPEDIEKLCAELDFFRLHSDWQNFANLAAHTKILGLKPEVTNDDWVKLKNLAENFYKLSTAGYDKFITSLSILGRQFKVNMPADMDYFINLSKTARYYQRKDGGKTWGRELAENLARQRIVGLPYELAGADWKQMYDYVEWARSPDASDDDRIFLPAAFSAMTILGADKVKTTDNGLEIIMPKEILQTDVPQMPEQKQF